MSNPSFSNIDRWFFELMEGNLSPEQVAQLESFLSQHPELDVDRDMWELTKVDSENVVYPNQHKSLRRRPVGIYMSLGFASIGALIGIGAFNISSNSLNDINSNTQFSSNLTVENSISDSTNYNDNLSKSLNAVKNNSKNALLKNKNNQFSSGSLFSNNIKPISSGLSFTQSNSANYFASSNSFAANQYSHKELLANNSKSVEEAKYLNLLSENLKDTYTSEIVTKEAEQIQVEQTEKEIAYNSDNYSNSLKFSKTGYKKSVGSKLNKMGRDIQRMMDNPVALKNMKDPYYHVPGMQAMDINFGAVGTLLATRVQTVSRAQWLGQENQQFMNQISIDGYSYGMRGGVGFQLNHNYYGKGGIENYNAAFIYSPKFSVARNVVFEPSIRFKMGSKQINSTQLLTGSTVEFERSNTQTFYSNGETPIGNSLWYKDIGVGLMVNTKWFYIGFQGDNLMRHYDNIYSNDIQNPRRAGKHYIATIGTDYESKKENITVSPYCVYQQQEKLSEAWLGVNLRYNWLTIGGAFSSNLEPAVSLGLKFDKFMLTYNADLVRSELLNSPNLSHQVTIRFLSKPSRFGQRLLNL